MSGNVIHISPACFNFSMAVLYLINIASTPLKLTDITIIKCSRTKLSKIWCRTFLGFVVYHYLHQQNGSALLVLSPQDIEQKSFKKMIKQERVYPYLIESNHSLYQLDCYLQRLREDGVKISLAIVPDYNYFLDATLENVKYLSVKYECHFLLRTKTSEADKWTVFEKIPIYSVRRIRPSQNGKYLKNSEELNLYHIKMNDNFTEESALSVLDEFNRKILYFPTNLKSWIESRQQLWINHF